MPIPLIVAGIAAASSIGGSAIASHSANSAQKKAIQAAQNDPTAIAQRNLIDQQSGYGKQMGDVAGRLEPQYESGVGDLTGYFKKLLSDDNSTALSAIAPLVRARKEGTSATLRNFEFMPRGGGTNEQLSRLYDTEHSDILDMLSKERETGRNSYMQLIGDVGSHAQNMYSGAAGVSGNAASLLGSMSAQQQNAGQNAYNESGQNSYAIGSALGPLLLAILNQTNTGTSSRTAPAIPQVSPASTSSSPTGATLIYH